VLKRAARERAWNSPSSADLGGSSEDIGENPMGRRRERFHVKCNTS